MTPKFELNTYAYTVQNERALITDYTMTNAESVLYYCYIHGRGHVIIHEDKLMAVPA